MFNTLVQKVTIITILAMLQMLFAFDAVAGPTITITPKWPELELDTTDCNGFSEDRLVLRIKDGAEEITGEFCSSYGNAGTETIKDALSNNFIILKFGEGRGTNAVSEYISVYKIYKKPLNYGEYVRIPISGPAGPARRWYYDYKITKPNDGGIIFSLILRVEGEGPIHNEILPNKKKRTIAIK